MEEKLRTRYVFGALGQILYAMPAFALLGMVFVMGGSVAGIVVGGVTVLYGIAVGFMALSLIRKNKGKKLLTALCFTALLPHVASLLLLGGWYAVLLPIFLLDMLLLSSRSLLEA